MQCGERTAWQSHQAAKTARIIPGIELEKTWSGLSLVQEVDQLQQSGKEIVVHLPDQLSHVLTEDDQREFEGFEEVPYTDKIPLDLLILSGVSHPEAVNWPAPFT